MRGLIFLLILLNCSIVDAKSITEEYWVNLKKSADRCFSGIDFDVKFEIGTIEKNIMDDSATDQYGKLIFSVPLLSKQNKIKRSNDKIKFLEKGAELIQDVEVSGELIKQKNQYLKLVKKMGGEEGLEILEKVMKIQEAIINLESKKNAGVRKLEGYFKCSEKLE